MLSRIAESMFWIGRYTERADGTARLLDVHVQHLLEEPWAQEETICRSLLAVMGVEPTNAYVGITHVVSRLGFDQTNPGGIAGALTLARENARRSREVLSAELWQTLNGSWLDLPDVRNRAERIGPHVFFTWVRDRMAMVAGTIDATMSRDDAWLFLVLGRSLERVDMTARLLMTRLSVDPSAQGRPAWSTLLSSCSAYEAALRAHRGILDEAAAVEFLLLDRLFPRSVLAALLTAEGCLRDLAPATVRAAVSDEARRLLGRARTILEYRSAEELIFDLPAVLLQLQGYCSAVSEAVSRRFFQTDAALTRAWEEVG